MEDITLKPRMNWRPLVAFFIGTGIGFFGALMEQGLYDDLGRGILVVGWIIALIAFFYHSAAMVRHVKEKNEYHRNSFKRVKQPWE